MIMFFSPLIRKDLKKGNIEKIDLNLIKLWDLNLIILALIVISGTTAYFFENNIIDTIYQTSLWIVIALIGIESLWIIWNLSFNKTIFSWKR
jgi:hypothetical protein